MCQRKCLITTYGLAVLLEAEKEKELKMQMYAHKLQQEWVVGWVVGWLVGWLVLVWLVGWLVVGWVGEIGRASCRERV